MTSKNPKLTAEAPINLEKKLKKNFEQHREISKDVAEIIRPLAPFGIKGFFHCKMYHSGEFTNTTARHDWAEHFFTQLYNNNKNYDTKSIKESIFLDRRISLWAINPPNPLIKEGETLFGYGNGITLTEAHENYEENYGFYSTADNHDVNNFYLNNIQMLKNFKNYFIEKADSLLKQSDQLRYPEPLQLKDFDKNFTDLSNTKLEELNLKFSDFSLRKFELSNQEFACLIHLAQGLDASEIAQKFNLSKRTIENYIANIKSKWNCKKSTELVYLAAKKGLI
jgi:DNA-binding CsgD family transcriptional regulator